MVYIVNYFIYIYNMENTEITSEHESIQIIERMIKATKRKLNEDSFAFLYWGWVVFIISVAHYILLTIFNFQKADKVWAIMSIVWIPPLIHYIRQRKKAKVKTDIDSFLDYLWAAFLMSMFLILLFIGRQDWKVAYPCLIMLYGIGTFTTGGILRFRPLIYGGILCWPMAALASYATHPNQILLLSASLLVSYIIPGHLLKAKKENV